MNYRQLDPRKAKRRQRQMCIRDRQVLNRANLGMEVMHERNAHNFPLDLASAESTTVALTAPTIG